MCGIAGAVGTGRERLAVAVDALWHRGPDSVGYYESPEIAFAMRRLAIIDLETGDQPLKNEDSSVVVVCNGEVYNYVELRDELRARGHVFSSGSDVAVVAHVYEEWGVEGFERLRGMFAIALWDEKRRRLVLARDRVGIKPLYVAELNCELVFASELGALIALGVPARPDPQAAADYLAFGYVPGESTGLLDIQALEPGTALVWENRRTRIVRFASIEPEEAPLEETFAEAVQLHLRSDVPLAVLLSGGLDSSLITLLAQSEAQRPLHTFAVGFGDVSFDELTHARVVANAVGTEHHEILVRSDIAGDLPEIVRRLDEPNGDSSAVPLFYVCRAAAAEVKVALAGEGGDEVFGGYSRYVWDRRARLVGRVLPAAALGAALTRVPGIARAAAGRSRRSVARRAIKLLRHAELPAPERYFSWFALTSDDVRAELAAEDVEPAQRVFAELFAESPSRLSDLGRLQYVDLRSMLQKDLLVKADRMSMAHSIELRVPFLDHRVVAAGLALSDREKISGVTTKVAIRELVEKRLPRAIARRPKQGFEVPIDHWLRHELAPLAKELLGRDRIVRHGLFRPEAVERRLRDHLAGDADFGLSLYGLMTYELWLEQVVDRVPTALGA